MLVRSIEDPEQMKCVKHHENIVLMALDENAQIQNQLLCDYCFSEKSVISKLIPWGDAVTMIQERYQRQHNQFNKSSQQIVSSLLTFTNIVDQMKTSFNVSFDKIRSTLSLWVENINSQILSGQQYHIFEELKLLANSSNNQRFNSIAIKQCEKFQRENHKFFQNLCSEFSNLSPAPKLQQLRSVTQQLQIFMEKNVSDIFPDDLQFFSRKQDASSIKCKCLTHKNELITMISIDRRAQRSSRALCNRCELNNVISIEKFELRWKEYQEQLSIKRQVQLREVELQVSQKRKLLQLIKSEMISNFLKVDKLQEAQLMNFREIIKKSSFNCENQITLQQLQEMAQELSEDNNFFYSKDDEAIQTKNSLLADEIAKLLKEMNIFLNISLQNFVKSTTTGGKSENHFDHQQQKTIFNEQIKSNNSKEIIQVAEQQIILQPQKVKNGPGNKITYRQISESIQTEKCYAVALNKNGTLMAAGCGKEIKIWELQNGILKETTNILVGHSTWVYCLAFSKRINWFASGSEDKTIRCWKEFSRDNWICSYSEQRHTGSIVRILLTKNEDQLLSCSQDRSIKVWIANSGENDLKFDYSLDRHTNSVYCISLNESETSLVSCSLDKQIIIWKLGNQKRWEFSCIVKKAADDYGFRVCFIQDDMIAWQQQGLGVTHIFQLKEGAFQEKPELSIPLQEDSFDNRLLFPTVFNTERQILIQKHNQFVYIIRKLKNGKFAIESEPIDTDSQYNYGGLTNNGQYLVIQNDSKKLFRVYEINYD